MPSPRYPLGPFVPPVDITPSHREAWIAAITVLPGQVRDIAGRLDAARLDRPYRDGGWTLRQVIHHLPDSHLNGYCRFRLALSEAEPAIRPYDQDGWASLPDARTAPIAPSLDLLDALHRRWVMLLEAMTDGDYQRRFFHPETGEHMSLGAALALYAWHGRHHLGHLELGQNIQD